ncbi:MAG: protease inhibitor I42 family protein [Phycisphaerales bacterium]|jgi:predicted secreted protein|nr:protease inhibitor I42 family protein [Phycisphaerales bacterium]
MLRRRIGRVALALIAGLAAGWTLPGCSAAPSSGRANAGASNEVLVTAVDAGSVIELKVGQLLLVELPESPSSGRVWQLVRRPDQLVLMPDGNKFDQTEAQKAREDLVGTQVLRFEAVGEGETILSLALVRPGTGLSTADERWMGQIRVR